MIPLLMAALLDITLERVVPGTPGEVYDLWVTREGVRSFFAPDAVIDARVGGEYTIIFAPEQDPEGLSHGTKGARILALEPGRRLVFEWISFTLKELPGVPGPPVVPAEERNVTPIPTAVELTFEPHGQAGTRVTLRHYGFGSGPKWEASRAFFVRAWTHVLDELERR